MKNIYSQLIKLSFCLTILFSAASVYGQAPSQITFRGEQIDFPENISSFQWNQMPETSKLNHGYTGLIQFYQTPTQEVQDLFRSHKMLLTDYIPHQTYMFHFPQDVSLDLLRDSGVKSIIPVPENVKISEAIKAGGYESWAWEGERLLITMEFHKDIQPQIILSDIKNYGVVKEVFANNHLIDLAIHPDYLEMLSNRPYVKWLELVPAPATPDDDRGRGLHRANGLDSGVGSTPRNYTGEGIGVMVRDDGRVGPHIDFQGRLTNYTQIPNQSHGDGVAGIMSGAGNLAPHNKGMAIGSHVYVVNYVSNFLDYATTSLIDNGSVQITNSSYSDGCNLGYTNITRTVDEQTLTHPSLLHVFSAGNSNNQNCGYGAGSQWGNITGGHKQGKNVIATANVFWDGSLVSSSSRGPAHDGRIKPDITAHGQNQVSTNENHTYQTFGGTSAAAPGIAGVSAQLYQAYADLNDGDLPNSALIKAALLNTANEAGNIGPDYKFGWGIVNGVRAAKLLEDERYLSDEVAQGATKTHNITIPAGTEQVRFMIYWHDAVATPGANPALVNDLDLTVKDPSNATHLPWILDPTPNPTTLDLPATRGIDRLNNVEQVLINNPAAGNYEIKVTGFNVPVGPQSYYLVYEIIDQKLTLTYPNGGEKFDVYSKEVIQWDAMNTTENYVLDYSLDDGATWTNIATVNVNTTLYEWSVPNVATGKALIRIKSGSAESISEENFHIARSPNIVNVNMVCPEFITFDWPATSGADSYDLYILGEKYMEVAGSSTTTSVTIPITDPNAEVWYALVAKNSVDGWESKRSSAKRYTGGLKDCTVGIEDNVFAKSIAIYPNPATSEVFINFSDTALNVDKITIANSIGQTLITTNNINTSSATAIDVSNFSAGIYFVTIHAGKNSTTKKLIIR